MKTYNIEDLEEIKNDLLNSKIVAFGTDTVFGLACVYDDEEAIEKVFNAKNRDYSKALPMMCSTFEMINSVAHVSLKAKGIMETFMPGPITIIYKKKDVIDDKVTSGLKTIGIRMPNDKWILDLINLVGKPLLVTSANLSNEPNLYKWQDVKEKLAGRIDGVVKKDASGDLASTIVDCSNEEIKILRQGPISIEDILNA